ncbi:MAG: energy transducer TonB, partial [Candidatus Baltobacteraceae bacterium]
PFAAGRPTYVWVSKVGSAGASPTVHCPAMWVKAPPTHKHAKPKKHLVRLNPSVYDPHALPPVGIIARAHAISEPASVLTCTHPFQEARVEQVTAPNYPRAAAAEGEDYVLSVAVAVELGRKGQVVGLGLAGPSGRALFDGNALYAASQTTYSPKIGLCRPVPGFYIFDAQYAPG